MRQFHPNHNHQFSQAVDGLEAKKGPILPVRLRILLGVNLLSFSSLSYDQKEPQQFLPPHPCHYRLSQTARVCSTRPQCHHCLRHPHRYLSQHFSSLWLPLAVYSVGVVDFWHLDLSRQPNLHHLRLSHPLCLSSYIAFEPNYLSSRLLTSYSLSSPRAAAAQLLPWRSSLILILI